MPDGASPDGASPDGASPHGASPDLGFASDAATVEPGDLAFVPSRPGEDAAVTTTGNCSQSRFGYAPPATSGFIVPARAVQPFYQWESNGGYCGEVSLMQAGLENGLWVSQYFARLLCGLQADGSDGPAGTPILQSGPAGYCASNGQMPDPSAELLLSVGPPNPVATCLSNARLAATVYQTADGLSGDAAVQDFVVWMKTALVHGQVVVLGVLDQAGSDDEYDHIVALARIGTNHALTDTAYHDDDVLYFEDHGLYTFEGSGSSPGQNPAVPPGAGNDPGGCTPYLYGVRAGDLAQTRAAFSASTLPYALAIPSGDGSVRNHGFAVSGPLDDDGVTLPVELRITSTATDGVSNPSAATVGWNYENPYIGTSDTGASCTNAPPASWMQMTLTATISGLQVGTAYNLYEYDFSEGVTGVGTGAALAVPTRAFNAHAAQATRKVSFTASAPTFVQALSTSSGTIVVLRAVPASAP